ncbi:PQQ-binding-like beta-propeller repeat protein [Botrimarina hoheduenensis]|uniref:Outer membrane biogenesis protein BamB n=1 Tax=Botrimarina hoheduenensis TaxID=2528000 RepID=A0A5C5W7L2_9BACT|nr:PQQ-binding-like beta-propeller repeat protein [Botrimarina hoheduenensis]TWT46680.1 outer membrane biogenesis protein BamB [Botrimarina hoheduenensis]
MRNLMVIGLAMMASVVAAEDWPQWRGPTADNHAAPGATAPSEWSETSGLRWRTAIPGRGHSSPTVVAERIYLTTADEPTQTQSLLILDRSTGALLKTQRVHQGNFPAEIHPSNTHASPTVASDGERVFALFYNDGSAWLSAFTLAGEPLWSVPAAPFKPQQYTFGFGSSPRVVAGLVVVSSEFDGTGSGIYAFDPATGKQVWRADRPESLSYSTPSLVPVAGKVQLMLTGNRQVAAYDPASGAPLWSQPGTTRATCGTMVWEEGLGLAMGSGGYPESFTLAIRTTPPHDVVWENRIKCYEQSLLVAAGHVYCVADNGVAYCWRAADGKELWKQRLGGRYSSSPVLVGDKIYVTNEQGTTFVFRADPAAFELLAENQLGTSGYATLTPLDGKLYHRYASGDGPERQEYLVAIGD